MRVVLGIVTLIVVTAVSSFGQPTGRVEGRVLDVHTGEPLVGGVVVIEATDLGNVTRDDGSYFINNVPAGLHKITAEYLGYTAVTQTRRVVTGETIAVDFRMPSDVITAAAIVALVEHEPWSPSPPERVVVRIPLPGQDLKAPAEFYCSARTAIHGAYILDGRWELMTSVRNLVCREVRPPLPAREEEPLTGIIRVSATAPSDIPAAARR